MQDDLVTMYKTKQMDVFSQLNIKGNCSNDLNERPKGYISKNQVQDLIIFLFHNIMVQNLLCFCPKHLFGEYGRFIATFAADPTQSYSLIVLQAGLTNFLF